MWRCLVICLRSEDDVLLVVGFNHIEGVSDKLRDKGFDVKSIDAVVDESV